MRYSSIDVLKAIAIFIMVMVHFCENLSGQTLPFAGLGASLFALLSGVNYRLWVSAQERRGNGDREISKISLRRGLFIFGIGFALNIFVWLPEDTFNWDVLTFIGFSLILLNFARKLPLSVVALIAIISLAISPVLRELADYDAYWENGPFEYDMTLSDVLIGFFTTGYFPIFPWIAYSLTGFVTGSLVFAESPELRFRPRTTVLLGTILITIAAAALAVRPFLPEWVCQQLLEGWTTFPPTVEYVLGTVGMALLLFGLAHQWVDYNPRSLKISGFLDAAKTFSRYSFTIYILHHLVHLWPLWIYGFATQGDPTYYWQKAMPMTVSFPLSLLFMVCCYVTLRRIRSNKRHGIEAWMRWLCD